MRRLLRWAFSFAAAASAVLLVATCVLWVRGNWIADTVVMERTRTSFLFQTGGDQFRIEVLTEISEHQRTLGFTTRLTRLLACLS